MDVKLYVLLFSSIDFKTHKIPRVCIQINVEQSNKEMLNVGKIEQRVYKPCVNGNVSCMSVTAPGFYDELT